MTHVAYFYKRHSTPVDGWRDRLTVACDKHGRLSRGENYLHLHQSGWTFIAHHPIGCAPDDVWDPAIVRRLALPHTT